MTCFTVPLVYRAATITGVKSYTEVLISGARSPFGSRYKIKLERLGEPFKVQGKPVWRAELEGTANKVSNDAGVVIDAMARTFPTLAIHYAELKINLRVLIEEIAHVIGDR